MSELDSAIDEALQTADVGKRLVGDTKHEIVCDIGRTGINSRVVLDGIDVSGFLRGVRVEAVAGELSRITFDVGPGQVVKLRAHLPDAQCVVDVSQAAMEVAIVAAQQAVAGNGPLVLNDVPAFARALLGLLGATRNASADAESA